MIAATNFLYDLRDAEFILKEWLDLERLLSYFAFKDYYSVDIEKEDATAIEVPEEVLGSF